MCMYISESKNCNFDKIIAVLYIETFIRSGYYKIVLSCPLETAHIL